MCQVMVYMSASPKGGVSGYHFVKDLFECKNLSDQNLSIKGEPKLHQARGQDQKFILVNLCSEHFFLKIPLRTLLRSHVFNWKTFQHTCWLGHSSN